MRLFVSLLLVISSFGIQADEPKWIYSGVYEGYQDQKFITGLGEGTTSEDAGKQAYSRLAEQIKVSISSQSDIVKEYRSTSDQIDKKETLDTHIRTRVDLKNIEGIEIVARYYQPQTQTYYALAVLNKVKTATNLSFKIESQFDHIRSQVEAAKSSIAKGYASEGIATLSKTSQVFGEIINDIELHQLFGKSGSNSLLRDEMLLLIGEFDQYLAPIFSRIQINSPDDLQKSGSPELGVTEPYRVTFTYNGQALKQIPISVDAEDQDVEIEVDDTTDKQGKLSVLVRALPYTGKQVNKIKVGLDIYQNLFGNRSPSLNLVVLLSQKSEVSILLNTEVKSSAHNFLHLIINEGLSSLLSEQNYHVLSEDEPADQVDYTLETLCTVGDFPGFSGMQFSKISGVIQIKSGKTKRVLKTIKIDAEATKAGALSKVDAAEKASILMVEMIRDELLQTLEKNLGRN